MRDIETIDAELRLVAALRHAARERGGLLPSIDVADGLLDELREFDRADTSWEFAQARSGVGRDLQRNCAAGTFFENVAPSKSDPKGRGGPGAAGISDHPLPSAFQA